MAKKIKSRKKKFVCELQLTYSFTYDPESKIFKDAVKSYKEAISDRGDEVDIMCHVAHNVNQDGVYEIVEGVGYISLNGVYPPRADEKTKSGIDTKVSYQKPDIDVISNYFL